MQHPHLADAFFLELLLNTTRKRFFGPMRQIILIRIDTSSKYIYNAYNVIRQLVKNCIEIIQVNT